MADPDHQDPSPAVEGDASQPSTGDLSAGSAQRPLTFHVAQQDHESEQDDEVRKTGLLSPKRRQALQQMAEQEHVNQNTGSLGDAREMILLIRGMVERLVIDEARQYILGRFEPGPRNPGEIDLTPYGAMDRGVSRHHLRIHFENGRLYVTDMGSTNGTFISKTRLEPNKAVQLRKGDELTLGRLPIQILFR